MSMQNDFDLSFSNATADSTAAFTQACRELHTYTGDPVASVDRALAASPQMTMAHALKAWLHLLGTEPAGLAVAQSSLDAASSLAANDRERRHLSAIHLVSAGRWRAAGLVLEDLTAKHPHDLLALQAGHLVDFFIGDARMLRDRIARALPAWTEAMPGYHALLGMYAFGLEECGAYGEAERHGRDCVEREPQDGWGWHAVAHVMEMQDRSREGIAWLGDHAPTWSAGSFFAVHNWWHLAVFHLERGDQAEVLRLFDGPITGTKSHLALELIDASALLWRLMLAGVDVGDRWEAIADRWAQHDGGGAYAFNDWHAMMAFTGSQRPQAQQAVLDILRHAGMGSTDSGSFVREVGLTAARAMQAFGAGLYDETLALLRPLRATAHRFGGSNAQRDIIDQTCIVAALRGGHGALAQALTAERCAQRPTSPLARMLRQRAMALPVVVPAVAAAG